MGGHCLFGRVFGGLLENLGTLANNVVQENHDDRSVRFLLLTSIMPFHEKVLKFLEGLLESLRVVKTGRVKNDRIPGSLAFCPFLFLEVQPGVTREGYIRLFSVSWILPDWRWYWCRGAESNCRHEAFQASALPTELPRLGLSL